MVVRKFRTTTPHGALKGKMKDWTDHLDAILTATGEKLLLDSGTISHEKAVEKAKGEYKIYQAKTLCEVEKAYLDTIKTVQKTAEKKAKEPNAKPNKTL